MHIKQWLQEDFQKRQCAIVINETLWLLGKIVEKKIEEGFYQQLLNLNYPAEFEIYFTKNLAGAVARGIALQNTINPDGKIVVGHHHERASILLVQNLIREKHAVV